jgi:hypothetical protein
LSAKGIDFTSNVPFCGATNAAVAREMTDSVGTESHAQSADADSRRGESGFNSGVSGTDNDDVKVLHCSDIMTVCDHLSVPLSWSELGDRIYWDIREWLR